MLRHTLSVLASFALLNACSAASTDGTSASSAIERADAGETGDTGDAGSDAPAPPTTAPEDACGRPPSASRCGTDSAWVRGIARFDPAHFAPGAKPKLRVALRHGFAYAGEEAVGGRLHGFLTVDVEDTSTGEIPFAIDMCQMGTSMWSEENGAYHLVLILDENDNNDVTHATSLADLVARSAADVGELVKMISLDVSCHAPSPCVDTKLDCTTGVECTRFQPFTQCTKKTPGCGSNSVFCH